MARRPESPFLKARRAEVWYGRQLRKIARHVAEIVLAFPVGDLAAVPEMQSALDSYSDAIEPWARTTATRMLADVNRGDLNAWAELSRKMRRALKDEIATAPTGAVMQRLLAEQVVLIKSLPTEAGERVHRWCLEGVADGTRAADVAAAILATSDVTAARSRLIARTEVSRAGTALLQARCEHIGSTSYHWTTAGDSDVRPSHKKLNGTIQLWSDPPLCDPPKYKAHPGAIFYCRCFAAPIIADT